MLHKTSTSIVTAADGSATVYLGSNLRGNLVALIYRPGASGLDTGADLTITLETSAIPVLTVTNAGTADVFYYPRAIPNKVADASAFTDVAVLIPMVEERIKVVVAQGGATKTGSIEAIWDTENPH